MTAAMTRTIDGTTLPAVGTWDLDPSQWMGTACRMAGRALTEQEWREYLPDRDYIAACGAAP